MTRFVEAAIAKAGLLPVLAAHRAGDLETVAASVTSWGAADLLVLGAVADAVRTEDVGQVVRVHPTPPTPPTHATQATHAAEGDVTWVETSTDASELDFLRAVAVARIAAPKGARIGVDWAQRGMELAQVALGFGASDLRGPITRKSGLPIFADEKLKVKGQGMVALAAIKRQEIAALVTHAGRLPMFTDDEAQAREPAAREPATREPTRESTRESTGEVAGV